MNKLNKEEKQRWYSYKKCGGSNLTRCKINSFSWSTANSLMHEVVKFIILYTLVKDGHKCLTEAVNIRTGLRHDLVDLTDEIILEVETCHKRAERFNECKNVEVIRLWKDSVLNHWMMKVWKNTRKESITTKDFARSGVTLASQLNVKKGR